MGSDDFFKKKKKERTERKYHFRTPKPNSFLIVTEGAKTEPLYFEGLAKHINAKFGKGIIVEKPYLDIFGEGKCTVSLVDETAKIVNRAPIIYENVWVVFDKDDFHNFDEAIDKAGQLNFKVAWSNQCFEYWLFLHFEYSDAALHRTQWRSKLDDIFKLRLGMKNGYRKNDMELFKHATELGSISAAIANAKRVESKYTHNDKYSVCDPCTKVHHLIYELSDYIEDLL